MNSQKFEFSENNTSLQTMTAINITLIVTIAIVLTSVIIYFVVRQSLEDQFSNRVLNIANLTALAQDGDLHSTLKNADDENSSNYKKISKENLEILNSDTIISSIFTMRQDENKNIYFVVYTGQNKSYQDGKFTPRIGDIFENASPLLKQSFSTLNNPQIEINQHNNLLESSVTVYAPFYNENDQKREGVIGININKNELITAQINIMFLLMTIITLLIPIIASAAWLVSLRITTSILKITHAVSTVSIENFGQKIIISGIKEIDDLSRVINDSMIKINESFINTKTEVSENTIKLKEQTEQLEKNNSRLEIKINQIKTLAFIARAILAIPNIDNLLLRIAIVISDALSFYHIGIFLLDDAKEYAILTATSSVEGQKLIKHNYRLKVGDEGIVGYVAGIARPRIISDTDKNMDLFINSDLPETHSQLAVPIKIGLNVIGVLDVQSKEFSAFNEEDITIFSIIADYIGIAIQNTQRFQQIQKTIAESDTLYRNYLRQEWKSFANQRRNPGYLYNISGSKPITKKIESIEIQQAIQSGKPTISQEKAQNSLSVPIKLRGQVIGILNIQSGGNHIWEEDEINIATSVADRVGLAVENARLLEDSQSRAARERTISEITSKIGASINIRNVLQTAVEELGHIMPGSDVIIQLKKESQINNSTNNS